MDKQNSHLMLRVTTPDKQSLSFCNASPRDLKTWIAGLPNIAKTWADTSGPAARDVLKAYFAAIRAADTAA